MFVYKRNQERERACLSFDLRARVRGLMGLGEGALPRAPCPALAQRYPLFQGAGLARRLSARAVEWACPTGARGRWRGRVPQAGGGGAGRVRCAASCAGMCGSRELAAQQQGRRRRGPGPQTPTAAAAAAAAGTARREPAA